MVLDVDALEGGQQRDVLWVLEQLPGTIEKVDMTPVLLAQGYWASFNIPAIPTIYNMSGHPAEQDLWHSCPRARMFAREVPGIKSLADLKRLLRLNRQGPISAVAHTQQQHYPQHQHCQQQRLHGSSSSSHGSQGTGGNWTRKAYGAVDAKVVDLHSFRSRTTHVICGPTADDQAPFQWSTAAFPAVMHEGLADEFVFSWQSYTALQEGFDADPPDLSLADRFNGNSHGRGGEDTA
ncbi:hypothetical protein QJQ45_020789 [Haematococcus lacustris]|nr:hypothetical protein QJQ45_020789 [Haematococcus lacustris]